ncbi:hypothetical protein BH23ACT9_BH23ACT9_35330 [soil metagenome]
MSDPRPDTTPGRPPGHEPGDEPASRSLSSRLDALEDAVTLLARHGFDAGDEVSAQIQHARARLRHGSDLTVVALVGSTGSGKSSLLNALTGTDVARTGITRPTTSVTQAVISAGGNQAVISAGGTQAVISAGGNQAGDVAGAASGADALLDLIGVNQRHRTDSPAAIDGLVLLDLPDFDSVAVAHRLEVDRLIRLVDLLVWVTDPQKYADEALHDGYLRRFGDHADVMQVVLNQIDTVPEDQQSALLADLSRLLAADGLPGLQPIATSATTPGGAEPLRVLLRERVADRRTALERIDADLRQQATALRDRTVTATDQSRDGLPPDLADDVTAGLAAAAGVDQVAALVASQYRRDAGLATGWPPLRFVRRLRRAPLGRLQTTVASQVATAEVSRTLRAAVTMTAVDAATSAADAALPATGHRWSDAVERAVRDHLDKVCTALDQAVSRDVQVLREPPSWWRAVNRLQAALVVVALAGGLWLVGLLVARSLLLVDVDALTPRMGAVPLPTLLLLGGLLAGLVTAAVARLAARIGGERHGQRAVASLRAAVRQVAEAQVIDPLRTVLADRAQAGELLATAASAQHEAPESRRRPV